MQPRCVTAFANTNKTHDHHFFLSLCLCYFCVSFSSESKGHHHHHEEAGAKVIATLNEAEVCQRKFACCIVGAWKLVTQHHTHKNNERAHSQTSVSNRVFPDFASLGHSSPSFDSKHLCSKKKLSRSGWLAGLVLTHKACNNKDTDMSASVKRESHRARLIQSQLHSSNFRHIARLLPS